MYILHGRAMVMGRAEWLIWSIREMAAPSSTTSRRVIWDPIQLRSRIRVSRTNQPIHDRASKSIRERSIRNSMASARAIDLGNEAAARGLGSVPAPGKENTYEKSAIRIQ